MASATIESTSDSPGQRSLTTSEGSIMPETPDDISECVSDYVAAKLERQRLKEIMDEKKAELPGLIESHGDLDAIYLVEVPGSEKVYTARRTIDVKGSIRKATKDEQGGG